MEFAWNVTMVIPLLDLSVFLMMLVPLTATFMMLARRVIPVKLDINLIRDNACCLLK
jgi:hypothetical protein